MSSVEEIVVGSGNLTGEPEQELDLSFGSLSDEQKSACSKVLFPETHTDKVTILGKQRELRVLTIKLSRRLNEAMLPFSKALSEAQLSDSAPSAIQRAVPMDDTLIESMLRSASILADFYEWKDVATALADEGVTQDEIQSLLVTQTALQGANDFLLGPLRTAIEVMRSRNVAEVKLRSLSTTQVSANAGNAPSIS